MHTLTPTILLVEDEPAQREVLNYNLTAEGYHVLSAADGEEALLVLREARPDLVVLDWMLPKVSGIEVCRQMRAAAALRDIPVIMLSARSEEVDRIRGLDIGADDYVVKPYSVTELVARVRAQLRRTRPGSTGELLSFEDIRLDPTSHRVTRADHQLKLGPTEFRLLTVFLERPGRVLSRDFLLDTVWGQGIYVDTRTVDVHVGRLRKSLCVGQLPDPIRTVRGVGYSLG